MKRETLTLIRPTAHLPLEVARLPHESDWHYAARVRAIHALGDSWVKHPAYRFQPRHSHNPEVWKPAFAQWWADQVLPRAAADRERNPAFKRAQALRSVLGSES